MHLKSQAEQWGGTENQIQGRVTAGPRLLTCRPLPVQLFVPRGWTALPGDTLWVSSSDAHVGWVVVLLSLIFCPISHTPLQVSGVPIPLAWLVVAMRTLWGSRGSRQPMEPGKSSGLASCEPVPGRLHFWESP
jgi:hypothetical protein